MEADLIFLLVFTLSVFFMLSFAALALRGRHIYRHEGRVIHAPVVVTSATHTAPGGYPVTVTQMPPAGYQPAMYAPYPPQSGGPGQMPMPMPMPATQPPPPGMQQHTAPYPPAPAANMNPPSYDMAVAGSSAGHPNNMSYEKQSPYNPSYTH